MTELTDAIDNLGEYNAGTYNAATNPKGYSGVGGMDANWVPTLRDVATAANGVADLADQAQQSVADAQQIVDDGTATLQAIATTIAGQLATSVPVSTQGRDLVAATTPDAAAAVLAGRVWCGTSGGTSNALTLTPVPALTTVPVGTVVEFIAGASNAPVTRQNLLTYNKQFDNSAWTKRGTANVTANAAIAPDGTITADLISGIGLWEEGDLYQQIATQSGVARAPSVYLRKVSQTGSLQLSNPANMGNGNYTINLALLSSNWELITSKHQAVTVVAPFSGTSGNLCGVHLRTPQAGPLSFYLSTAQLEPGAESTPPIPATTAPVTVVDGHSTLYTPALGAKWLLDANGAALGIGALIAGRKYHATYDGVSWRLAANTDSPAGLTYRLDQLSRNSVLALTSGGRL